MHKRLNWLFLLLIINTTIYSQEILIESDHLQPILLKNKKYSVIVNPSIIRRYDIINISKRGRDITSMVVAIGGDNLSEMPCIDDTVRTIKDSTIVGDIKIGLPVRNREDNNVIVPEGFYYIRGISNFAAKFSSTRYGLIRRKNIKAVVPRAVWEIVPPFAHYVYKGGLPPVIPSVILKGPRHFRSSVHSGEE